MIASAQTDQSAAREGTGRDAMSGGTVEIREALVEALRLETAGQREAAKLILLDLRGIEPSGAEDAADIGVLARQLGLIDEALHWFQAAVRLAPDESAHIGNLGNILRATGRLDEAVECYERVIEAVPDSIAGHNNLGLALKAKGALQESVEAYRRGLSIAPGSVELNSNIGMALLDLGKAEQALDHCRVAFDARPDSAETATNVGYVLKRLGRLDEAARFFDVALDRRPDHLDALLGLGAAHMSKHRWKESLEIYRRALDIDPDCAEARRIVAALAGGSTAPQLATYVSGVFDGYAEDFDRHLVEVLGYSVPRVLADMLAERYADRHLTRALDVGCGTGLFGMALKQRFQVDRLIGIDLSPRMIEKAAEKAIYDALETGELVEYLRRTTERLQLISACDVFIYVGDLAPVFAAARDRLTDGGHFGFSIEEMSGETFALTPSGRYAHARAYLDALARDYGFSEVAGERVEIRRESGTPVMGSCVLLRKA